MGATVRRGLVGGVSAALLVAASSACGASAPRTPGPSLRPASGERPVPEDLRRVGGEAAGFTVSVPRAWAASAPAQSTGAAPARLALSGPLSPASTATGSLQGSCQAGKVDLRAGTAVVRLPGRLAMRVTDTIVEVAGRRSLRSASTLVEAPAKASAPVGFTDIYSIPAGPGHECVLTFGGPDTEQARVLFQRLAATIRLT